MNFIKPFVCTEPHEIKELIASFGGHGMVSCISANADGRPFSSFLPADFILSEKEGEIGSVGFHYAHTNEQADLLTPDQWLLIEWRSVDRYISPSWFVDRNRAPTNIHLIIQCYGRPRDITGHEEKRAFLTRQVETREKQNPNAWQTGELSDDGFEQRLRMIRVATMEIAEAKASIRMLQDESVENVRAVIDRFEAASCQCQLAKYVKQANAQRL